VQHKQHHSITLQYAATASCEAHWNRAYRSSLILIVTENSNYIISRRTRNPTQTTGLDNMAHQQSRPVTYRC
jgi:hypothetical protein